MFTKAFIEDLLERVVSTFLQALIAALGLSAALENGGGFDITKVHWLAALGVAGGAAFLSLVKGLVAGLASPNTGASLGTTVPAGDTVSLAVPVTGDGDPGDVAAVG